MTLTEWFADRFGKRAAQLPTSSTSVTARAVAPKLAEFKLQVSEGLYRNSAVQGCILALTGTLPEAPVVVVRPDGEYVPNHRLEQLFRRPNAYMSGSMFLKYVAEYFYTGGNAYIHVVRNEAGVPLEMYPYHSGHIVPVPSPYQWIDHYLFQFEGETRRIPTRDIIHLKWLPDPLNPILGLSPIEVAGQKVQALNEMDTTIFSVMRNNGVPGTLMFLQSQPSTQQQEVLREMWSESFTGSNRGKLGVLSGDIRIERLAQSMTELQAEGLYGQLEASICGVFRVHPAVAMNYAGLLSSTYSNMETAFREFTTLTRVPVWKDWADQLTTALMYELGGLRIEFDTTNVAALQNDEELADTAIAQYGAGIITLNEARERAGYEAIEGGDSLKESGGAGAFFDAPSGETRSDEVYNGEPLEGEFDGKKLKLPETRARAVWKRMDDIVEKYTDKMQPHVAELMTEAGNQATSLRAGPDANRIDVQKLVQRFMQATGPLRQQLLKEIMQLAVTDAGGDLTQVTSFIDEIEKQATREVADKMKTATETTKQKIATAITKSSGQGVEATAKAVREAVKTMSEGHSKTVARTTIAAQTSTVQQSTWSGMNKRESDPKRKIYKVWITQRDSDVRASHEALDGQVVAVDGSFGDGITAPGLADEPGDAINCRCVLATVRYENLSPENKAKLG